MKGSFLLSPSELMGCRFLSILLILSFLSIDYCRSFQIFRMNGSIGDINIKMELRRQQSMATTTTRGRDMMSDILSYRTRNICLTSTTSRDDLWRLFMSQKEINDDLPFLSSSQPQRQLRHLSRRDWIGVVSLGLTTTTTAIFIKPQASFANTQTAPPLSSPPTLAPLPVAPTKKNNTLTQQQQQQKQQQQHPPSTSPNIIKNSINPMKQQHHPPSTTPATIKKPNNPAKQQTKNSNTPTKQQQHPPSTPKHTPKQQKPQPTVIETFKPINLTTIAQTNTVNITLYDQQTSPSLLPIKNVSYVNRQTYTRVTITKIPFIPKAYRPTKEIIIPNSQLLLAAIVAGSATEMVRTVALYPLQTIKSRLQVTKMTETNATLMMMVERRNGTAIGVGGYSGNFIERAKLLSSAALGLPPDEDTPRRRRRIGVPPFLRRLYGGLFPSLLGTVPSSGVYCGIRDVTNRMLRDGYGDRMIGGDVTMALLGAFVADVIAVIVRTPADVLALRLQVTKQKNATSVSTTEALRDGVARLPVAILTDLPYLLSRLFLNKVLLGSGRMEALGRYEVETIVIACVCAALTTPFDVVRTRIFAMTDDARRKKGEEGMVKDDGVDSVFFFAESVESKTTAPTTMITNQMTTSHIPPTNNNITYHDQTAHDKDIAYEWARKRKWSYSKQPNIIIQSMINITREGDGGYQNLFAGWIERTIYLGLGRAWLDPIRVIGYLGIRDAVLLRWFGRP